MWFFQFFHHKRHGRSCWVHCIMGKKCSVHSIQCDVLYHAHFDTCSAGGHLGILCIENLLTVHRIYSNRSTVVCYSKHYYFVIAVVLKLHSYLELSWNTFAIDFISITWRILKWKPIIKEKNILIGHWKVQEWVIWFEGKVWKISSSCKN